mmetsp:Transcript_96346/g.244810  ORF Transcript_96346/g.244810 Transcript_96346/m.244810 type:complete len:286 (+) Transcript_96346:78-935(+)
MEAPSAVDAGQARTFPSPVKHSTVANNRSVSTRAPSESGTLASAASYLTERVQQHKDSGPVFSDPAFEDDLFNDEFEPEADELLEDCGAENLSEQSCQSGQMGFLAQSRSELTSPVFSDSDDDGRGGFNLCQTQTLALDFDEDLPLLASTTAGSMSPTFRNFLDGDDEEIGMCVPMLKLRTASFQAFDSNLGGAAAFDDVSRFVNPSEVLDIEKADVDIRIPTPPPQPPPVDKARFNHIHCRVLKTPDKELDDDHSRSDSRSSSGMAGAAGVALIRWRRSGRCSP